MKYVRETNEKGITLIALCITLIILIILSGISVSAIAGKNGIISKVEEAISKTKEAYENENKEIANISDEILQQITGTEIINGAPIPTGYYYVGGTRESGVVISDDIRDKEKYKGQNDVGNELNGNQWVWVPLEDPRNYYKIDENGIRLFEGSDVKTHKYTSDYIKERSIPGKKGGYREPEIVYRYDNDNTATMAGYSDLEEMAKFMSKEYNDMIESLEKYNGFYIGRYELSENGEKKGITKNNITWYEMYKNARELSKNEESITSMIWGLQWDATCKWLEKNGYNMEDASNWGNYTEDESGNIIYGETGLNEKYKANNIYDFAGNYSEWTQEACNVLHRTATDIKDWNNSNTPLNRSPHRAPGDKYFNVGTRAILIVK